MGRVHFYLRERIEDVKRRVLYESYEARKLPPWERVVITWIVLFTFWVLVAGWGRAAHLLIAAVVTLLIAVIMRDMLTEDIRRRGHLLTKSLYIFLFVVPQYLFIMVFRLIESNLRVVRNVILLDITPGIVKIEADLYSDTGLTILANSITLTPGTLTLDVEKKLGKAHLYVHWINVETLDGEKAGRIIKGDLEEWLKKIFW